jgi:hypothetical protein
MLSEGNKSFKRKYAVVYVETGKIARNTGMTSSFIGSFTMQGVGSVV